ncbi:tetratricopeptide repeat protein [Pyxidicoccus fallax]|uniref:Tetratricopeptide repeat protein n=2 Tax=Pyxidicoccus fallax TaxID=394095 RepID=A0A848LUC3_9BACT|nr:tetratricopeptide repeat protein [Pyxidicoccus fallax]NPC82070.1 tetratricopeptide repeat protein [Pyxidicoccus fallax]
MALLLPGPMLAQTAGAASTKVPGQEDGFRARLQTAVWLYEELEYEQSLKALTQAKPLAKTDGERALAALYEGAVLADLGQRPRSLTAFREALSLDLEARLPVKVSPKVERDFEAVREEVRNERAAQARARAQPTQPLPSSPSVASGTTDRPLQPSTLEPGRMAPPTPSSPTVDLSPPQLHEERSRRLRPLPLVLLGAGVVAGGLGGYFGLQSRGNIEDARGATSMQSQSGHLEDARSQALIANVLFGAALTAAAGAAITWFTGTEPRPVTEVSP